MVETRVGEMVAKKVAEKVVETAAKMVEWMAVPTVTSSVVKMAE